MASYTDSPAPLSWHISVPVASEKAPDNVNSDTRAAAAAAAAAAAETPLGQTEHFLCSSDTALIQLDALNDAIASDLL
ncbi:MAG: hypothetical protein STHCBS139747_003928 [Sporothrix thermara]